MILLIGGMLRAGDHSDVATGVKYGVALPSSWSNSMYNSEMGITRITCPLKNIAFCKGEHLEQEQTSWPAPISLPQGQAPRIPHG